MPLVKFTLSGKEVFALVNLLDMVLGVEIPAGIDGEKEFQLEELKLN